MSKSWYFELLYYIIQIKKKEQIQKMKKKNCIPIAEWIRSGEVDVWFVVKKKQKQNSKHGGLWQFPENALRLQPPPH